MVHEKQSPVQKPADMVIDATRSDSVAADTTKSEARKNEGKQASNKPAKRRITPMAIDP